MFLIEYILIAHGIIDFMRFFVYRTNIGDIMVVLIGLVVIFRDQLTDLMNSIFERIIEDSNAV